ncbi:rod shape-determining protein MreC [Prevotella sp. KH2C16]|uniref:rod shape-determining protein MreC n=1 Tax=Prevotella sp. KH2C16 TaxID=1855325 RepID=UPI0008F29EF2|nr:rod shape-determining protein MreC [Prevotella sp. KH2C16]SFG30283.1 rod shape-determining protein MreC [Prevotella sp. KH2C16]
MRNLLEFLSRHSHWFLFVLLEVLSFVLVFQYNSYQGSVWFSSANTVVGQVYEWESQVESFFSLTEANEELTLRNIALEQQLKGMRAKLAVATGDTNVLHAPLDQQLSSYRLIQAKVVSNSLDKVDNLITVNKGSADGVKVDMGVVSGNGVVGIVYQVSPHYAVVIPVLNSHSSISCMIQDRGYFGYLHWNGGYRHLAYVDDVPRHAKFRKGDYVVTSGYSSVFPSGIRVGQIKYVFNSPDGLSYRLKVQLATDFGNLRDVVIIDNAPLLERQRVLQAARDSIGTKDNK